MNGAGRRLEEMAQQGLQMEEDGAAGEHMKAMWAGQSNVLVSVRVRPLMKHDVVKKSCVRVLDSKVVVIMDPASGDKQDILRANRNREKQYAFDYVFEQGSSQDSCYHHTTKFLIHGVLDGFNATVFAYGQTGSGKTYTMVGTPSDPGIMVRVMGDLFVHSVTQGKQQGVHYKVTVSFLEVYNENIRDLLSEVEEYLDLREDPIKGPVVASITEIETTSSAEIMQLLLQGNAKRSQAATAANEVSSRSHAVLQVVVESRDRAPGTVANIKVGKLSLVDLAGSERAANTKNVGARLVEGANINRSLLALGNCINALGEKGNKGNFVPYRDSKLTRLLKDSLGGNCRTVMIANISSAESSFEETLNTLKYANRAKNIKTHVQRNVLNVNYHISEYVQLIDNLRSEIQLLKGQIGSTPAPDILSPPTPSRNNPSTPFHVLRESMRTATASLNGNIGGEGRELVNNMRQRIVENFQERMQLRRSLIELEDQNVQNSIEVSKRQLIVVQWSETNGNINKKNKNGVIPNLTKADFAADILANGTGDIVEAWQECEQLRKAIMKNNGMKKNIAKRLRHNEREAEKFRDELGDKITGEDRRELMELQYQVGRLELENMELEQHRIVHESILKGKDLVIQKLKLQLAVRDKLIQRQQVVLQEHDLDGKVGYSQLALLEQTLMGDSEFSSAMAPPSPPRNMSDMPGMPSSGLDLTLHSIDSHVESGRHGHGHHHSHSMSSHNVPRLSMPSEHSTLDLDGGDDDEVDAYGYGGYEVVPVTERAERGEVALSARDRDFIEQGDWSEINNELTDNSFGMGKSPSNGGMSKNNSHQRLSNPISRNNTNANSNASIVGNNNVISVANIGAGGNGKAIHGPRGGRHFRSAATDDFVDQPAPSLSGVKQSSSFKQPPQQVAFKNNNRDRQSNSNLDSYVVEDSDNDSERSRNTRNNAKKGTPRSHRQPSTDKLDPIPLVVASHDEGILSGRRYENNNNAVPHRGKHHHHGGEKDEGRQQQRERDLSPRGKSGYDSNSEAPPAGAYAPIYPSLFNKDKDGAKGGGGRGSNANQDKQPAYRRNSRDRMDDEAQGVDNQLNDLNIGGRGVSKQSGSNVKNVALGRLKVKGNVSNSNLQVDGPSGPSGLSRNNGGVLSAAEIAPLNAPPAVNGDVGFSLNVNGSGFNGNQPPSGQGLAPLGGGNNVAGGVAAAGGRAKLKPSRKLIQKSVNAGGGDSGNDNGGNLSIDGVGSEALNGEQLSYRNKSLPNLPKQLNAPNSARGV